MFRPDDEQRMLDAIGRTVNPGYPAIGRLKGLAELCGVLLTPVAPSEGGNLP